MSWTGRLSSFARFSWGERGLLLEAWLRLGSARLAVFRRPFREVVARYRLQTGGDPALPDVEQARDAAALGLAVRRASMLTPWESTCLVQAVAAVAMLARRRLPASLYLGAARTPGGMAAHAWVQCGEAILTGESESRKFSPVAVFHLRP